MLKTTVKTIGEILSESDGTTFTLPAGFKDDGGQLQRSFILGEMTGKVDEKLADKKISKNPGKIITEVVTHVVEKLGNLPQMKREYVRKMYQGDRDFILIMNYINSVATDNMLRWTENCPSCNEVMEIELDYNQINVHYLDDNAPRTTELTLPRGIRVGDKFFNKITVSIPDGVAQEELAATLNTNPGLAATTFLANCTVSIEGLDNYNFNTFKDMIRKDRQTVIKFVSEMSVGPDLSTKVECPSCGRERQTAVHVAALLGE